MAIQNDMIVGMGSKLTTGGTGDLQKAFNSSQKSQAWFFSTAAIKIAAKYKPFNNTTVVFASETARDTARANANYGLTIPKFTAASDLIDADWTLHRPNGTSYPRRAKDFEGYYRGAPDVPVCCTWPNDDIVINLINENVSISVPFFVYQKEGLLKDWRPDSSAGMVRPTTTRSNAQIDAICAISELNASGGAVITSLDSPYLGLAIFSGTTLKKFVGCRSQLVAKQEDVIENNMFILHGTDITEMIGTYTAVPCIRYKRDAVNYGYIPLPKGTGNVYKNKFNLIIGGADKYKAWQRGVSLTSTIPQSPASMITMTSSTLQNYVYVIVRVQNLSGIEHYSTQSGLSHWYLHTWLSGEVRFRGDEDTTPIGRTVSAGVYNPGPFTIANDGTVDLVFRIPNIWSVNASDTARQIDAGMVTLSIAPTDEGLKYVTTSGTDSFGKDSMLSQLLTIKYGTL